MEYHSTSKVRRLNGHFTFRVEGYSGLQNSVGASTESPEFSLCGHLWQLRIFPGGSLEQHKGYVSYYLASKSDRQARASYKLTILNQKGGSDESFSSSGIRIFEPKGLNVDGWGRDRFVAVNVLNDSENSYCVNDIVIFKVELTVYGDLEMMGFPVVNSSSHDSNKNSYSSLAKCMYKLLKDDADDSADILLVVGEDKVEMIAHKCILRARSPIFRAMLSCGSPFSTPVMTPIKPSGGTAAEAHNHDHDEDIRIPFDSKIIHENSKSTESNKFSVEVEISTKDDSHSTSSSMEAKDDYSDSLGVADHHYHQDDSSLMISTPLQPPSRFAEAATGRVVIPDVSPEAMQELLTFMYTDAMSSVSILETMAVDLLMVSAKYQVITLYNFVEDYLCLQVIPSNCLALLQLSHSFDAFKLKDKCMMYLVENTNTVLHNSESVKINELHQDLQDEVEAALDKQQSNNCCQASLIRSRRGQENENSSADTLTDLIVGNGTVGSEENGDGLGEQENEGGEVTGDAGVHGPSMGPHPRFGCIVM